MKFKSKRSSNVDDVKIMKVIRVKSITGEGIEGDPKRQITEYFSIKGERLSFRVDYPCVKPRLPNGAIRKSAEFCGFKGR